MIFLCVFLFSSFFYNEHVLTFVMVKNEIKKQEEEGDGGRGREERETSPSR